MNKSVFAFTLVMLLCSCDEDKKNNRVNYNDNDEDYEHVEEEVYCEEVPEMQYVETRSYCSACMGNGFIPCTNCGGAGAVPQYNDFTGYIEQVACPYCLGNGGNRCMYCQGTGIIVSASYQPSFKGNSQSHEGKLCSNKYNSGVFCDCPGCYAGSLSPNECIRCHCPVKDHNGH